MPAVRRPPFFGEATADGDTEELGEELPPHAEERTERRESANRRRAREDVTASEALLTYEVADLGEPLFLACYAVHSWFRPPFLCRSRRPEVEVSRRRLARCAAFYGGKRFTALFSHLQVVPHRRDCSTF